ncbi:hypothetical protein BDW74DRAFT_103483 [Aspergillus multicolor]|uniref:uncharacterized protein n=1 Tax=Aspergillus multicolor TaxID=41759 RepID=UPI003CCDD476
MRASQLVLAAGLAVANWPHAILAKECNTTPTPDAGTNEPILRVSSLDDLATLDGCTSLTGHIVINYDYDGDFILNGVTSISGNLTTSAPADNLGLVELLDLTDADNIWPTALTNNIHLPELERAGSIDLVQASSSGEIDLGKLTEADNVRILGSWTTINLSCLETVADEISICGSRDCGLYPDEEFPYLDVDLPSLKSANRFNVAGTIKTVSVPSLEIVGTKNLDPFTNRSSSISQSLRLNIQNGEFNLEFDAPKLRTINGFLEVYGAISKLSLGALGETNAGATFIARAPLEIYSTIKTAEFFYIWGELASIELPNFTDLGAVDLSYEEKIPCNNTLYKLWDTIHVSGGSGDEMRCVRPDGEVEELEGDTGADGDSQDEQEDGPASTNANSNNNSESDQNGQDESNQNDNDELDTDTDASGSGGGTSTESPLNTTNNTDEAGASQTDITGGNAAYQVHALSSTSTAWISLIILGATFALH